jgi:hypothetical protein
VCFDPILCTNRQKRMVVLTSNSGPYCYVINSKRDCSASLVDRLILSGDGLTTKGSYDSSEIFANSYFGIAVRCSNIDWIKNARSRDE